MSVMPIIIAGIGWYVLVKGFENEEKLVRFEDKILNKLRRK